MYTVPTARPSCGVGTGDAGRRDADIRGLAVDRGGLADALRHLPRHLRVHGALRGQERGIHPQQGVLERRRVGDDAAAHARRTRRAPTTSDETTRPPVSDSATATVQPRDQPPDELVAEDRRWPRVRAASVTRRSARGAPLAPR